MKYAAVNHGRRTKVAPVENTGEHQSLNACEKRPSFRPSSPLASKRQTRDEGQQMLQQTTEKSVEKNLTDAC